MAGSDRALGDIATRLLADNDRVRIWEMDLAPGEESAPHEHTMDYVLVVIEGDRIAGIPEPGSPPGHDQYVEVDVHPGDQFFVERGGIEVARNTGTTRYREIAVELKG